VSEARSKAKVQATRTEDAGEVDEIADGLYALRADEFAAARDAQVRKARADGHAGLARALNTLRKPSQSAWLINLLWRDQRDLMEQLFELAEALSQAQAQASGSELLRLTAQRRELEAALKRRARALAEKAGVSVSATMEREAQETLAAALAQPEVAAEVRTGRLVKPAAYAGFGTFFPAAPAAAAQPRSSEDTETKQPRPARQSKSDDSERERHEAAERQVAQACAALDVAARERAERGRAADAASKHKDELQQHQREMRQQVAELQKQLEHLQRELRDVEAEVASAEQTALVAARQRDQADKAHEAAARTLAQAEQRLKD
jgi:hypothetical protein